MRKVTAITAVIAITAGLAACGGSSSGSMEDLRSRAISAAESGSYVKLMAQCSPATRAEAMSSMVFAQAFDPNGEMLKAMVDTIKDSTKWTYKITGDTAIYGPDNDKAVKVDGKWWMDCSDVS